MTMPNPPHLIDALAELPAGVEPEQVLEEAPARRQIGMLYAVDLEDDISFEVRVTNRDLIAWEKTKARHREWPSQPEAPFFATTFVVWNAAVRAGLTALRFEQFEQVCLDLNPVREVPADPTR